MGMRLLIVGGAGYFGARLAEALAVEHEVTVTQRSLSPVREAWTKRVGLCSVAFDSAVNQTLSVDGEFDAIINLAMPGAAEAGRDAPGAMESALTTARACVRLLDEGRAARLLHFSTFHVYGAGGRAVFDENNVPAPVHPYGETHLACERVFENDERVFVLRPTNMVGVPAHAKLLFVDLCRQAAAGVMKLHNHGLSYRDFLPFSDAIEAVKLLLVAKQKALRLFNLASGEALRLDAVATMIRQAAGTMPTIELGAGQDAFRAPFRVTNARLRALGWSPRAALFDEAQALVKFFQ